jgi:uncharacterized protein
MKAVLALVLIYVGTFLVAIQGASQNSVQAAQTSSGQNAVPKIDPTKEADIRSLMELVGARDQVQDAVNNSSDQFRERLLATIPNNEKGQDFVNAFTASYQKKFDVDQMTSQLVSVYDAHFTDDEIKALLQFYGSPLGQKVAAEMPKINREIQSQSRSAAGKAAKEALQEVKAQNPGFGQAAHLGQGQGLGQRRWQRNPQQPQSAANQTPDQQ